MRKLFFLLIFFVNFSECDAELHISEIFPNPSGQDSGKEWIELYNSSNQSLDLESYSIQMGKKSINLSNKSIPSKSHKIIETTLNNNENTISLLQDEKILESISYQKAPEAKSYTHIIIKKGQNRKSSWIWTNPTKNQVNPVLQEIYGKVTQSPTIDQDFYLEVESNQQKLKILIESADQFEALKNLILPNSEIALLTETQNGQNLLREFEIKTAKAQTIKSKTPRERINYFLIPVSLLLLVLFFYFKRSLSSIAR